MKNDLLGQIDDFQKTMDRIVQLVEEAKTKAGVLQDASIAEGPGKVKQIFEICDAAINELKSKAIPQAEDMENTLGGR